MHSRIFTHQPEFVGTTLALVNACVAWIVFFVLDEIFLGTIFEPGELALLAPLIIYGCLFVSLPAIVGGFFLARSVRHDAESGALITRKVAIKGLVLGAVMGLGICVVVIILIDTHAHFNLVLDTLLTGRVLDRVMYYLTLGNRLYLRRIVQAAILAALAGGCTGGILAKYVLSQSVQPIRTA
jgi:hypothetical protein